MSALFEFEISKLLRRRLYYIGFIALTIFLLIYFVGFENFDFNRFFERRVGWKNFARVFGFKVDWSYYVNGYLFCILCVAYSFHLLIPIFVSLTGGYAIAGEAKEGTLRAILSRPVSRTALVSVKFLITSFHSFALILFLFGVAFLTGVTLYGGGDLLMFRSILLDNPTTHIIKGSEFPLRYILASLFAFCSIFPLICISILLSVIFENPTIAIVSNITLYFILTIIVEIPYYEELKPYIFTTYMGFWKNLFAKGKFFQLNWSYMMEASLKLFIFGVLLFICSLIFFKRREIRN